MINDLEVLLALRTRLLTLSIATTGSVTLGVTGTPSAFTRSAGSFIADGFKPGMEVTPTGFLNNVPAVIQTVEALVMTTVLPRATETPAAGRSLTVGIPALRSWEGNELNPLDKRWYIEEDYLPGSSIRVTLGKNGDTEHDPTYAVRVSGLSGFGVTAMYTFATAVLELFPPNDSFSMADGQSLYIRSNPAPYRGQLVPGQEAGRVDIPIVVPLLKRSKI